MLRRIGLIAALALGCQGASAPSGYAPGTLLGAAPPAAVTTLRALRARLDRVDEARRQDRALQDEGRGDVDPLRGLSRSQIAAGLGNPYLCGSAPVCQAPTDWYYEFHHLRHGSVGGGWVLILRFDPQGICVGGDWVVVQ